MGCALAIGDESSNEQNFAASEGKGEIRPPVWTRGEPRIAGATHVGVVRKMNQDAFGRFDDSERSEILLVVADGLGGHRAGEVASHMAVEHLGADVLSGGDDPPTRLRQAVLRTNDAILKAARQDRTLDGMGTTIVCLLLVENGPSYVAHVGDSRLYRLRSKRIEAITEDHSLVAALVREGVISEEDARQDPRKNQILRALGVREDIEVDIAPVELQKGDIYLLCSDGLHCMLEDTEIHSLAHRATRPEYVVNQLIEAANEAGGTDNVTCVLAHVPDPMPVEILRNAASRLIKTTRSIFSRSNDPDHGGLSAPPRDGNTSNTSNTNTGNTGETDKS